MTPAAIVQKLWNYCNVLRDDGMSYGDYVERTKAPFNLKSPVPAGCDWTSLVREDGDKLFDHYRHLLERLGKEKGLLGLIFGRPQNKFQDPAKLKRLIVDLIGRDIMADLETALEQLRLIAENVE